MLSARSLRPGRPVCFQDSGAAAQQQPRRARVHFCLPHKARVPPRPSQRSGRGAGSRLGASQHCWQASNHHAARSSPSGAAGAGAHSLLSLPSTFPQTRYGENVGLVSSATGWDPQQPIKLRWEEGVWKAEAELPVG